MSYWTDYTLTVRKVKNEKAFESLKAVLRKYDIINYALDEGEFEQEHNEAVFYPFEETTWYRHSEDMVMISERFPKMYFELSGIGEAAGDYWKEYYHDGDIEMCRGEVVYEQPKKVQWQDLIVI